MKITVDPFVAKSQDSPASSEGNFRRIYADFRALDHALLDSDVETARVAFAWLQQDSPALAEVIQSGPGIAESPRRLSLKLLATSLQNGAIKQAQLAFALLQQTAKTDTRDPFSQSSPPFRPRTFWSAIDSEG
jgi:hypothetical protein